MNAAHLHMLWNHVPVIGALFGLAVLAYGIIRGKDDVVRVALWPLIVVGLAGLAAYLTGEPAEEVVERLPGVSEGILERHEEAALVATIGGGVVGLLALVGLALHRGRPVGRGFAGAQLVLTLALVGGMAWTANLGGQIRHPEIRAGVTAEGIQSVPGRPRVVESERYEAHDDDDG